MEDSAPRTRTGEERRAVRAQQPHAQHSLYCTAPQIHDATRMPRRLPAALLWPRVSSVPCRAPPRCLDPSRTWGPRPPPSATARTTWCLRRVLPSTVRYARVRARSVAVANWPTLVSQGCAGGAGDLATCGKSPCDCLAQSHVCTCHGATVTAARSRDTHHRCGLVTRARACTHAQKVRLRAAVVGCGVARASIIVIC